MFIRVLIPKSDPSSLILVKIILVPTHSAARRPQKRTIETTIVRLNALSSWLSTGPSMFMTGTAGVIGVLISKQNMPKFMRHNGEDGCLWMARC